MTSIARAVAPFLPFALFVLILGVGLGAVAAFVPGGEWVVVVVLGVPMFGIIALDSIDTYRRGLGHPDEPQPDPVDP